MKLGNTVQFNSLKWVMEELRQLLTAVQRQFELYLESEDPEENLEEIDGYLRQIRGTLTLIEIHGAALLSEEMQQLILAIKENTISNKDNAHEVFMRAALKLPDYLDSLLVAGGRDVPFVLLPLLNDLRASRNASLLSENFLFFPDMDITTVIPKLASDGKKVNLKSLAKRIRHSYQLGLLSWFRNKDVKSGLERIKQVLDKLSASTSTDKSYRLWWIASAIVDSLLRDGVESSVALKSLMGQVDRQIKAVTELGEEDFNRLVPDDLLKNLLYYIARSEPVSDLVKGVQKDFELSRFLPKHSELENAERQFIGPNLELLNTVSRAIREDVNQAKDILDVYVHADRNDLGKLKDLMPLLSKIADTLGMLGLGNTRDGINSARNHLLKVIEKGKKPNDEELMSVASVLLSIDDDLQAFVEGRQNIAQEDEELEYTRRHARMVSENQKVIAPVVNEALRDIARVKDAFLNYLSQPFTEQPVSQVLYILKEIKGAMFVPPLDEIVPMLERLYAYVEHRILSDRYVPKASEQNLFADAITSVECYLEAVSENRLDAELYVESGLSAVEKLELGIAGLDIEINEPDPLRVIESDLESLADDLHYPDPLMDKNKAAASKASIGNKPQRNIAKATAHAAWKLASNKNYETLQIISDDTDEEILEIFLEEALEELGSISEQFPIWKQDTHDQHAITTLRRSFHTLKGSGRLVGAALIGEFSWCMENMLNRVIEGTLKVSADIYNAVDEAIGVLPQLIEQIRGNKQPIENVFELMHRADFLASGGGQSEDTSNLESPTLTGDAYLGDNIEDTMTSKANVESLTLRPTQDNADLDASTTGLGNAIHIDEIELSDVDDIFEDDDSDIGLVGESENSADYDGREETAEGAKKKFQTKRRAIDPVLLGIFTDESESHLHTIADFISEARHNPEPLTTPELLRALHTLNGSSKTARFNIISEVANLLEQYANNLNQLSLFWSGADLDLMDQSVKYIYNCIEHLKDHTSELHDEHMIMSRLRERLVRTEMQIESQKSTEVEFTGLYEDLDPELVEIFMDEAEQLIDSITRTLQQWMDSGQEEVHTANLMRQLHTLKGGARMASLSAIGDLSHTLESIFIAISAGYIGVDGDLETLLQTAVDRLAEMLEAVKKQQVPEDVSHLVAKLEQVRLGKPVAELEDTAPVQNRILETENEVLQKEAGSRSTPDKKLPKPIDAASNVISITGSHNQERMLERKSEKPQITQVEVENDGSFNTVAAREQIRVRADKLDTMVNFAGEVNVFHSRLSQYIRGLEFNLGELGQTVNRLRNQLREMEIETEAQIASRYEREAEDPNYAFDPLEMDRYSHMQQLSRALTESTSDLDNITETLHELVRESESALQLQSRVSTDLQDELLQTRMVKFEGLSTRMRRIVRQTSRQLKKKVELHIEGEKTEIDRSVQDRMLAPLEHMLRNAVFHGIEAPDERVAARKPETGNIHISIGRDGSYVVLKISDDGRGIDPKRVRAKALEHGLISANDKQSDQEILRFILHKGFSTARDVSQIAGRGVGMDVVDSEVKQLGGSLTIDSKPGKGTTFVIRLPLTLAINQALMLQAGDDIYAIPLTAIEGVSRIGGREFQENIAGKKKEFEYAGQRYRMYYLGVLLGTGAPSSINLDALYPLLLVRSGDEHIALSIDAMAGRREIVVKPVGPQISTIPGFSGATILADGRVALILDIGGLIRKDTDQAEQHTVAFQINKDDQQLTVMVVDDSITIRKVTARILGRHRLRVLTAKDGVDAIEQLQENIPDLFLMDIEMPRMDGFELAGHVRSDPRLVGIPIIMITSRTGQKHRERAEQIGVNRYLGKPFQENELMDEINQLLGRQQEARA